MTQRSSGFPAPSQVIELLGAEFARAGYEIERVAVEDSARPPRLVVVADGDKPLDLDTVAELSRAASQLLDELPDTPDAYVLEVTSPGVDRPLTEPKHFRRAHARLVEFTLQDGSTVTGRIGSVDDDAVEVLVKDRAALKLRTISLGDIGKAVVQVEFSPVNKRELEMLSQDGKGPRT